MEAKARTKIIRNMAVKLYGQPLDRKRLGQFVSDVLQAAIECGLNADDIMVQAEITLGKDRKRLRAAELKKAIEGWNGASVKELQDLLAARKYLKEVRPVVDLRRIARPALPARLEGLKKYASQVIAWDEKGRVLLRTMDIVEGAKLIKMLAEQK